MGEKRKAIVQDSGEFKLPKKLCRRELETLQTPIDSKIISSQNRLPPKLFRTSSEGFKEDVVNHTRQEGLKAIFLKIFAGEINCESVRFVSKNEECLIKLLYLSSLPELDNKVAFSLSYNIAVNIDLSDNSLVDTESYELFKTKYNWIKWVIQGNDEFPSLHLIETVASYDFSDFDSNISGDMFDGLLHFACKEIKDPKLLEALINEWGKSRKLTETDENDRTPLHIAADKGNISAIKILSKYLNIGCNVKDSMGDTPLHVIIRNITSNIAKFITANKKNISEAEEKIDVSVLTAWVEIGLPTKFQDSRGVSAAKLTQDCGLVKATRLLGGDIELAQRKVCVIDYCNQLIGSYENNISNSRVNAQHLSEENKFIKLLHYLVGQEGFKDDEMFLDIFDHILILTPLKQYDKFIKATQIVLHCGDLGCLTVAEYAKSKGHTNILQKINEYIKKASGAKEEGGNTHNDKDDDFQKDDDINPQVGMNYSDEDSTMILGDDEVDFFDCKMY